MKKFVLGAALLLVFFFMGCSAAPPNSAGEEQGARRNPADPGKTGDEKITGEETTTVVLYFAGTEGYLVPEQREVPKVAGIARKTMEELCKGPESEGLLPTMPRGTRLLDINIRDGLCTVDFSKELVENHPGGSSGELVTVYSIVNTLTQFPSVEKVVILVEGQRVQTLAGHLDLSIPLERNPGMLKS